MTQQISKKVAAYTLIEVMVALAVFAILAAITATSINNVFNIRTIINKKMDKLNTLQMMMSIVEQDLSQIVARSVRGPQMRLFPSIVGQHEYLEFTRGGISNPQSIEKRSTLKRVGLLCTGGKLVRRTYPVLDTPNRDDYHEKVLLTNLKGCYFSYLNEHLDLLPQWREQAATQNQPVIKMPNAIELILKFDDKSKINLLYPLS